MIEADMLCDRVAIIDYGKIAALDIPANLKRVISGTNNTVVLLNITNLNNKMVSLIQSLSCVRKISMEDETHLKVHAQGDEAFDDIIDTVRKNNGKISSIKNIEPTLEDVFLHITGHEVRDQASSKGKNMSQRHGRHGPHGHAGRQRIR